jgi:3-hydroxyisobutyrate dehydrogenase
VSDPFTAEQTHQVGSLTIGFVGLGNMGGPMVRRIIASGATVRAFDLSPEARARAVAAGAEEAETAAEAASGADIVILMLPNSAIVTSVVTDPDFATALAPGAVVLDMSSSEPNSTRKLAADLAARGVALVDAPVSGGVKGAVAGTLTIMVGGAEDDIQKVTPLLLELGKPVRAGGVGAGHAVKALNNLLSATHLWVTSEAIEVGKRFGLEPEAMLTIFNGSSGRSGSTENKWPNFILPGTFDSGFGLGLMLKDMRIAVGLSEETGAPSRLGEDAVALWAEAADALGPTADHTEVARWIEQRAGAEG